MMDRWTTQSSPLLAQNDKKPEDAGTPAKDKATEQKPQSAPAPKPEEWGAESSPLLDLDEEY